jgi:hypothetical protein
MELRKDLRVTLAEDTNSLSSTRYSACHSSTTALSFWRNSTYFVHIFFPAQVPKLIWLSEQCQDLRVTLAEEPNSLPASHNYPCYLCIDASSVLGQNTLTPMLFFQIKLRRSIG